MHQTRGCFKTQNAPKKFQSPSPNVAFYKFCFEPNLLKQISPKQTHMNLMVLVKKKFILGVGTVSLCTPRIIDLWGIIDTSMEIATPITKFCKKKYFYN